MIGVIPETQIAVNENIKWVTAYNARITIILYIIDYFAWYGITMHIGDFFARHFFVHHENKGLNNDS
jgi:hypothetical protein